MSPNLERAYRVLGLTPGAPRETVHRAYRDLAQVWHPDRFAHNPRLQDKAERNLRRINEAYELLRELEPPEQTSSGVYARLSETFSAVLGLGDILKTSEIRRERPDARQPERRSGRGGRSRRSAEHSGHRSAGARRHTHHAQPRARPEHPSGRPAATPPPVVGVDTEDRPIVEKTDQPVAIWLVLFLSLLLVVVAVLIL